MTERIWAKIENDFVVDVCVGQDDIWLKQNLGGEWVETFPTTVEPVYRQASPSDFYDREKNIFYAPKPFKSWIFSNTQLEFVAPKPYPIDNSDTIYTWSEEELDWIPISVES
jgi:hypothetical protein